MRFLHNGSDLAADDGLTAVNERSERPLLYVLISDTGGGCVLGSSGLYSFNGRCIVIVGDSKVAIDDTVGAKDGPRL